MKLIEQAVEKVQGILNGKSPLGKSGFNQATGLVFYDLEAEAKLLYPVICPIRKRMARIGKKGAGQGLAAHWNVLTNPNSGNTLASIEEGKRAGAISPTVAAKVSFYKGIGLENAVTWEAEYASEGYDNLRALAQRTTLDSLMLAEEPMMLWGNSGTSGVGLQFGVTPTPVGTAVLSGGTLADATYYIYCVALSYQGYYLATGTTPNAVQPLVTRTNADGTTTAIPGGSAIVSLVSTGVVVSGGSSLASITNTVTAVKGACAYAWFIGTTTGVANAYFSQVTTINKATITSQPSTGQLANATGLTIDYSYNPLAFDGLITQAMAGSGYYRSLDGAKLTPTGTNGIVEVDVVFKFFWDVYKTSPTRIYTGSQSIQDLTNGVMKGNTGTGYKINLNNVSTELGKIVGSAVISEYVNKFAFGGGRAIPIEIHPNMPDGYIFFDCEDNPYPTANIPMARAIRTRRDYFNVVWPITTRNWQNGIYADEMLQLYVPFALGLLSNIGAGLN